MDLFLAHPAGAPMSLCRGVASVVCPSVRRRRRRPSVVVRPHFTKLASSPSILNRFVSFCSRMVDLPKVHRPSIQNFEILFFNKVID